MGQAQTAESGRLMAGYVWKGTVREVVDRPLIPNGVFDPSKCGQYPNYRQHYRYKIPVCDKCRKAYNDYEREREARKRAQKVPA